MKILFNIAIIAVGSCFAIGCGAPNCRVSRDSILNELHARISTLDIPGKRSIDGYKILQIRQSDDSLNESSSVTIRLMDGKRYKLVIYDDCYSKWFHLDP